MRLIDSDLLLEKYPDCRGLREKLKKAPTIDAVPVVRCKDCKHFNTDYSYCHQSVWWLVKDANDFCSYGERKDGAECG